MGVSWSTFTPCLFFLDDVLYKAVNEDDRLLRLTLHGDLFLGDSGAAWDSSVACSLLSLAGSGGESFGREHLDDFLDGFLIGVVRVEDDFDSVICSTFSM